MVLLIVSGSRGKDIPFELYSSLQVALSTADKALSFAQKYATVR